MKKISFEEHFLIESVPVKGYIPSIGDTEMKCQDLGEGRLKDMEEAGIDMQVLSPGMLYMDEDDFIERLDASEGTALAKSINDGLSKAIKRYPKRFAGLASLAPQDTDGAADELERAVMELGLKGGQTCSNVRGEYLDNEKFGALFERAEKLSVPIYIHPRRPSPDLQKPFMTYAELAGPMLGYGIEGILCAMRMICGGVFDRYPSLKIVLGHMGEALPFWLWRIGNRSSDRLGKQIKKNPSQYIKDNIFITTSGMFFQPALLCAHLALGADRILFAVDYPMESNKVAVEFMDTAPICDSDKEKIYHLNAEKLLGL